MSARNRIKLSKISS